MARIENTISLRDSCSGTLDRITRRMAGLTNSMYRASSSLDHLGFRMSGFGNLMRSTFGQFTLANIASNAIINLVDKIREIPGAVAQASDSFVQMESRLGLVADKFGDSTESMLNKVYQSTIRARSGFDDIMSTISRLGLTTGDTFKNTDELIQFAETMNKAFTTSATTGAEKSGALLQMAQALGSGLLQGDELRSLRENAPMIYEKIAEYMKVPTGALKDLGAEGEITAGIVKNAVLNATDEINRNFNKMPTTWEQNMQRIKNAGTMAFKGVYEQINQIANSEAVQKLTDSIIKGLEITGRVIAGVINEVRYLGGVFKDFIEPVFYVFAGALSLVTGELVLMVAGFLAGKVAVLVWNAALAAGPIYWAIAGIYLLAEAISILSGRMYSAGEIIFGTLMVIGSVVYNIAAIIVNVFLTAAEVVANIFANLARSINRAIGLFALGFIKAAKGMAIAWNGFVNTMADAFVGAINIAIRAWNKLVDMLPDTIKTKLGLSVGAEVKRTGSMQIPQGLIDAENKINRYIDNNKPDKNIKLGRMRLYTPEEAFNYGAEGFGLLSEAIEKRFSGKKGEEQKTKKGAPFTGEFGKDGNKPRNVRVKGGKLDKNQEIKIAEESMKILLDLARREVQLNYQQITPQFNVTFGDVHETANVDKVLSAVEQKIVDIYESNLH